MLGMSYPSAPYNIYYIYYPVILEKCVRNDAFFFYVHRLPEKCTIFNKIINFILPFQKKAVFLQRLCAPCPRTSHTRTLYYRNIMTNNMTNFNRFLTLFFIAFLAVNVWGTDINADLSSSLPSGWTGTGTQKTGYYQLGTTGNYIQSPVFTATATGSVSFSIDAYVTGSSKSSSCSLIGLDKDGNTVETKSVTCSSSAMTSSYPTTTWTLTNSSNNIKQVKFVYTKADGSNMRVDAISITYTPSGGGSSSVETPTFSPAAGSYSSTQSVSISCGTAGATIYYTTDGSTPTTSSSVYSSAISVSSTTTIKAYATKAGMTESSVASATYTITGGGGGSCAIFGETWAGCDGTGGNSGGWSGSIASSSSVVSDNSGWTYSTGYKGNQCIRTSKAGTATTPSISVTSGVTYSLSYKAADWGTDGCSFTISATGANVTSGSSSGALSQGSWGNYSATLTATASTMQITFTASSGARGWLDEICIDVAGPTYTVTATVDDLAHGSVSVSGNTITVTPNAGWVPNSYTVTSGTATAVQSGNVFTVTPTSDCAITIGFRAAATYTVTLIDNGKTTTETATEGVPFALPDEGESTCDDATFLGWATGEYANHLTGTTVTPTYDSPGTEKSITANTTFTAVYGIASEGVSTDYTKITSTAQLTTGDYMIVAHGTYADYAMGNSITSSHMAEETVTISSNTISNSNTALIWRITKTGDNYTLYNEAASKYLALSTASLPVLQTSAHNFSVAYSSSQWIFESTTVSGYQLAYCVNTYYYESATSQYIPIHLYKRGAGIGSYTSKPQCCQAPATALAIESDVTNMVASGVAHLTLSGGNGKTITWNTTGGVLSGQTNSGATLTLSAPGVYTVTATQADDETDSDNVICGATVTVNITVKAQYTIIFNTKDNGVVSEYSRITVTEGDTYTMPDISEDYDCGTSGASFAGWVDNLDDTSVDAAKGSTQTATADKTWYAAWSTSGSITNVYLYTKVTSISELTSGCTVLIGNTDGTYAMGAQRDNNRAAASVSQNPDNENQIYFSGSDVKELTVGISGSYYTFYDAEATGYLYAASSSSNYLKTKADLDNNGKFEISITAAGVATMTAQGTYTHNILKYNSSSKIFSCYSSGQANPAIYKKSATTIPVTEAGTTITTNNTFCDKGATIVAETGKWITSANGQKVKLVLPVTARGFESAATLSAVSSNAKFTVTLAETAVPVAPSTLATTLTVEYTPTTAEDIENTTVTFTAGEVTKNIVVNGRSLPDEFVIIAKKTVWYALPANMNNGSDIYDGINVVPDDASEPTMVPVAPSTTIYRLQAVAPDRYASAGNCVRLVGNGNKCLWANSASTSPSNTKIQNYAVLGNTNGDNYEWLLTTTDGVRYTISNPAHPDAATGRILANGGTGGTQFGLYKSETSFYIVPVGCSSQPGNVLVVPRRVDATFSWVSNASEMTIDVYTNEAMTSGNISRTATSTPYFFSGLAERTDYWFKLTPGTDVACAVTGSFSTTGPVIDIVEWEVDNAVIFVDKDESVTPKVIIDGEVEHGVSTGASATELFFSKYFEGSGNMKLLAFFNGTSNDISLADYKLYDKHCGTPANETALASSTFSEQIDFPISALGTIKAGQEIILYRWPDYNADPSSALGALYECSETFLTNQAGKAGAEEKVRWIKCDGSTVYGGKTFPAFTFNGNDAICLEKSGTLIDVIGTTGTPGKVKNCANRLNDVGWTINVKNIDYGKASDDPAYDALFDASSLSPSNDAERREILAGFNVNLDDEYIDMTTARCILFRDKTVTSGERAVALNTGTEFTTCNDFTYLGEPYKSEWNGRKVCMSTADQTAAGVSNDAKATCNSYQDLGAFDYSSYYKDWSNIDPGLELDDHVRNADEKTYDIPIPNLAKYSCLNLRFQLKDGETVLTETPVQVPILVDGSKTTNSAIFNEIVKTDGGDPVYDKSINRCRTCDVVILGTGTLTKATDGATNDAPQVGNLKIYPGGKLIVPEGASYNYTVNSLAFRRQEDEVPSADIQGVLNVETTNSVYLDIRIDPTNWHYFTLPYDCNISNVTFADGSPAALGTDYLLKWYNGEKRAATQAGGCWEMVASDAVLKKGLGYIIGLPGSGKVKRELRFPMANDVITDDLTNKTVTGLYGYGCDKNYTEVRANHRGWNLVGNPYFMPYTSDLDNPVLKGEIVEDHSVDPWDGHYKFNDPVNDLRYIVEPVDNGWSEYRQVAITNYPMKQFTCYFVQIGAADPADPDPTTEQGINFHQTKVTGRSSVVSRRLEEYEEKEDTHPVWCAIDITNSKDEKDETTLLISNDFTDNYDMMNDLVKMRGDYYQYAQITTKPVLASRNNEGEMAFNALPDASAVAGVPLNFFAAYQGSYAISYNDKFDRDNEVKEVQLFDKTTNQWYDLMSEPYEFTSSRVDNKDRFILSVRVERKKPQTPTGLEDIDYSETPRKILINGHVYIQRGNALYDVTGKQLLNR